MSNQSENLIEYHEQIKLSLCNFSGEELTTKQIKTIIIDAWPDIPPGSILPGDHSDVGNKGAICACCGTNDRIFDRVRNYKGIIQGRFRIRESVNFDITQSRKNHLLKTQGFMLVQAAKKEIELQAMRKAKEWLKIEGYTVADRSAVESFDFEATKNNQQYKIEVKGTTNQRPDSILMTRNEVNLHREARGATGLIVVYDIKLIEVDGFYKATGGLLDCMIGWDINQWDLEPLQYKLYRK